jgi:ribokinase
VYLTGGDAGAVRAARATRVLTATPRARAALDEAGVRLDALIGSALDPGEHAAAGQLRPAPALEVWTEGAGGGHWLRADGGRGRWQPAPLRGPVRSSYGAGDSFAAAFTFALGAGQPLDDALALAARCGADAIVARVPPRR